LLDLALMNRIRLSPRPPVQRFLGWAFLTPNYRLPPRVEILLEGDERLPDEPVVYAMNHTDRYNYWPFQYQLWRARDRFTSTWVKAKYYRNRWLGRFMELTNNIPTPSRGYVIVADVMATLDRHPTDAEYAYLSELARGASLAEPEEEPERPEEDIPEVEGLERGAMRRVLTQPRDILGLPFEPARATWAETIDLLLRTMQRRFVELNRECFELGLDLLVFPQGTRSVRLSRGHSGLAQIALHFERPIVPIGCNGSDLVYPGGSPWGRSGRIVYRFGEPLWPGEVAALGPGEAFEPFSPEAELAHRPRFQAVVDLVMSRINELLDERHQFAPDGLSEGVVGSKRFL
jgi:1-acyl-sn-glycerol-3-phosphate acyltransferase